LDRHKICWLAYPAALINEKPVTVFQQKATLCITHSIKMKLTDIYRITQHWSVPELMQVISAAVYRCQHANAVTSFDSVNDFRQLEQLSVVNLMNAEVTDAFRIKQH